MDQLRSALPTASPKPGGLLGAMQARGTLPSPAKSAGSAEFSPALVRASPLKSLPVAETKRVLDFASPLRAAAATASAVVKTFKKAEVDEAKAVAGPLRAAAATGTAVVKAVKKVEVDEAPAAAAAAKPKGKAKAKPKAKAKGKSGETPDHGVMSPPEAPLRGSKRKKPAALEGQAAAPALSEFRKSRPALPPKSEEDNYEISDREDSGDTDEALDRTRKRIPAWCVEFASLAHKHGDVDPDSVFGPSVPFCDLDDIFPDAMYRKLQLVQRKRARGSSCHWHADRLTGREVQNYALKMGQRRRLSVMARKKSLAMMGQRR